MTTITLRTITGGSGSSTKNAPLTIAELDTNFNNLNNNKIESSSAVSTNTPNTVVKRDASGNFNSATINAETAFTLKGSSTGITTFNSANAGVNNYTLNIPAANTYIPISAQQLTFSGPTAARTYTLPDVASTLAATGTTQTWSVYQVYGAAIQEFRSAMAANDINLRTANYFTKTISTATTFTVSNVPAAGTTASFILDLTNGGAGTITWWTGVKWTGGVAPTLTISGRDVLGFFTHDGGTTWTGLILGKDIK